MKEKDMMHRFRMVVLSMCLVCAGAGVRAQEISDAATAPGILAASPNNNFTFADSVTTIEVETGIVNNSANSLRLAGKPGATNILSSVAGITGQYGNAAAVARADYVAAVRRAVDALVSAVEASAPGPLFDGLDSGKGIFRLEADNRQSGEPTHIFNNLSFTGGQYTDDQSETTLSPTTFSSPMP